MAFSTFTKNKQTGQYDVIGTELVAAKPGDQITVHKANGSTTTVTIERLSKAFTAKFGSSKGQQVRIASIRSGCRRPGNAASNGNRRRSGRCRGCGGEVVDARHHQAMEGYCGNCAFDEFDM